MLLQVGARRVALHELADGKRDSGGNLQGIQSEQVPTDYTGTGLVEVLGGLNEFWGQG